MAVPIHPGEVPKDLICSICMELPLDPCLLKQCSHVFCRECIVESFAHQNFCPICRSVCRSEHILPMKTRNTLSYRILSSIAVKCELHTEGCGWTGSLSDYRSHKNSCPQKAKITTIRSQKEEIERLKTINAEVETLKEENVQLNAVVMEVYTLEEDNLRLRTENDTLEEENDRLKTESNEAKSTYKIAKRSLKEENNRLKVESEEVKTNYEIVNQRLRTVITTKVQLKRDWRRLKRKVKDMQQEKHEMVKRVISALGEVVEVDYIPMRDVNVEDEKAPRQSRQTKNPHLRVTYSGIHC